MSYRPPQGGGGGGGGSTAQYTANISSAQIRNAFNTPPVIVPGTGGKRTVPLSISIASIFGTTPYQEGQGNIVDAVVYAGSLDACTIEDGTIGETLGAGATVFSDRPAINQPNRQSENNEGADLIFTVSASYDTGAILSATAGSGGGGYAPGDTGDIENSISNPNALYVVDTVDGGGAVLAFSITAAGTGYAIATGLATDAQTGAGAGFTVDVTAITPLGDGTLSITTTYVLV